MIICIGDVLDPSKLEGIRALAARGGFKDGRGTAGGAASTVKKVDQLPGTDPAYAEITAIVAEAVSRNEVVAASALPRLMSRLLISRAGPGMGYGPHADNAVMGDPPIRTDLAFTVFINNEDDYDGGELVVSDAQGDQVLKLPAGAMALYPATTIHRVNTVTRGERLVVVGWIQSLVRDPRVREMLLDLSIAERQLLETTGKGEAFDLIAKSRSNLLRLFAET